MSALCQIADNLQFDATLGTVDLHQHALSAARDDGTLVRFALASRWVVRRGLPTGVSAPPRFVTGLIYRHAVLVGVRREK